MRPYTLMIAIAAAGLPAAHAEIQVGAGDLQKTIDAAPPHSTVVCDPNRELTLATPFWRVWVSVTVKS